MMKKVIAALVVLVALCTSCVYGQQGDAQPVKPKAVGESASLEGIVPEITRVMLQIGSSEIAVNERQSEIKAPYAIDGVTMVPLRALSEAFGAEVGWDGETQGITVAMDGIDVRLTVGDSKATVNGAEKTVLRAPELYEDTTMIPLRFVSESLGADVAYYETDRSISVVFRKGSEPYEISAKKLEECKNMILEKIKKNGERFGSMFPEGTKEGVYNIAKKPGWVGGFYTGLDYICYDWSGDEKYVDSAKAGFSTLKDILDNDPEYYHHDLGFTFMLSYYQDYLQTGSEASKQVVIKAADTLMRRFNNPPGYIRGWNVWGKDEYGRNNQYRMIVDSMCNIPILFTCTEITGDPKYQEAAISQAKLTQQYLVRKDFTTTHTFVFDKDGNPRFQQTHQGAADTSCWARGHAWVINGMALAYEYTGDESFLQTSKDCTDTYLKMTDTDLIPRWDLIYKNDLSQPKDTSAASIIACGMMDIWEATGDAFYKDYAYKTWSVLYDYYSSKDAPKEEGLIREAVGHKPNNQNVTCSLIYGDYYFAQLTQRLLDLQ